MKNKLSSISLILICLLFFSNKINSQELNNSITSGRIKYEVSADWTKKNDAITYLDETEKSSKSFYRSSTPITSFYSFLTFDSQHSYYEETDIYIITPKYQRAKEEYFLYRDHENNSSYDVVRDFGKLYLIEDSIKFPKWKIMNNIKEVLGHMCMNAYYYDSIRMNHVVAWFALDMPLSYGPDNSGGLPGMILELDINKGAMTITALEIDLNFNPENIDKPKHKKKINRITRKDYDDIVYKHIQKCIKAREIHTWKVRYF